jgi:hypothetical protein
VRLTSVNLQNYNHGLHRLIQSTIPLIIIIVCYVGTENNFVYLEVDLSSFDFEVVLQVKT